MAVAIEAMGLSLPYSSSTPAADPLKMDECRRAVDAIRILLERDIKPRDIMTRKAFENAITVVSDDSNRSLSSATRMSIRSMLSVVQPMLFSISLPWVMQRMFPLL